MIETRIYQVSRLSKKKSKWIFEKGLTILVLSEGILFKK